MAIYEGKLEAQQSRFAVVISRFNAFITERLLEGCMDCIARHGGDAGKVDIIRVPGSFEIPLAAQKAAASGKYDAVICLGAVIRGGTPHFDYIAGEVTKGIAQVSLNTKLPVIFGVLTTESVEEAIERAGTKHGNKGWEAALSAIEMVNLLKSI